MAFKMKGFSGFGNSPVKQVKPLVNPKFKKFKEDKKQTRTVKKIERDKLEPQKKLNLNEKGEKFIKEVRQKPNRNNIGRLKDTVKRTTNEAKKEFTKQVRRNITRPTRGEVISAFINPLDIKSKKKVVQHYVPKIKRKAKKVKKKIRKFLDTPVKKRK